MSDYLVRFFLNTKTGAQQRHMTQSAPYWVLGERIGADTAIDTSSPAAAAALVEKLTSGNLLEKLSEQRFFEDNFDESAAAVAAFDRLAAEATAQGFFLTDLTDRYQEIIPPNAKPKPDWQQSIDALYLKLASRDYASAQAEHPLSKTEPLWLLLKAQHIHRLEPAFAGDALEFALAARDELNRRKLANQAFYCWSISPIEVEAGIHEQLFFRYADLNDTANAFKAIREAVDLSPDARRSENLALMQCFNYAQYRQDAFDTAFQYGRFGGYDDIRNHPEYAAYAARREAEIAGGTAHICWMAMCDAASAAGIVAAETELARRLPADYRTFLERRGKSKLAFYLGNETTIMTFAAPADIADWQHALQQWFDAMGDREEHFSKEWAENLGVDRRQLYSVATPWDNSSCLVMSLAEGKTYGHCYLWHHDEAYELVPIGDSFDEALETLTRGFSEGDPRVRTFLL